MKDLKCKKGITLVALIVTIIILLILAVVTIRAVQGDEIIQYAKNAKSEYEIAQVNEDTMLEEYLEYLDGSVKIVDKDGNDLRNKKVESNTEVYDKCGNKIVIPAGFKIRVDDTTNNADTVTEGIVVEDASGNQFVWIPVGTIYTNTDKTESKTITLGRYSNFTVTDGVYTPTQTAENYETATTINSCFTEDTEINHNSSYENAIARDIGAFITSAIGNGGYYLGRYEAGDSSNTDVADRTGTNGISTEGTLVCKANQVPYNWITQPDASSKCKSMYADGYSSGTFSSDLINSYAWDTAIVFIQIFGTKSNSNTYASTIGKSVTTAIQLTGTNILIATGEIDEQLNIYDIAGSEFEWSTETYKSVNYPCVWRGDNCFHDKYYSSYRWADSKTKSGPDYSYRPLLYIAL